MYPTLSLQDLERLITITRPRVQYAVHSLWLKSAVSQYWRAQGQKVTNYWKVTSSIDYWSDFLNGRQKWQSYCFYHLTKPKHWTFRIFHQNVYYWTFNCKIIFFWKRCYSILVKWDVRSFNLLLNLFLLQQQQQFHTATLTERCLVCKRYFQ